MFSVAFNDKAGNQGNTKNFTSDGSQVNVDITPPNLDLVRINSDNQVKSLAKAGDQISLEFRSLSPIETPRVMINGEPTHLTGGGTSWNAFYMIPDHRVSVSTVELNVLDQNDNEIPVSLNKPAEIKVDSAGNIYIADLLNHRIVKADVYGLSLIHI